MVLLPKLTTECLVLGLGNPFWGDDSVGHRVAERLSRCLAGSPGLTVQATSFSGIRLLDLMVGYERLILVDSITTGKRPPGSLHILSLSDVQETSAPVSVHHFSIGQLLDVGRRGGLVVPCQVRIYAIEIEAPREAGEALSPAIEAVLEPITREILLREFPEQSTQSGRFPCREESRGHGVLCR